MYLNDDRDDVAFLTGSGSSSSGRVYSKRDLYERGHVAVCSHRQAICITVFVFSSIFFSSLAIAFARPWNDCGVPDYTVETIPEAPKTPKATNGEEFPWNEVRLPIFIRPVSYDLDLTPNLETLEVKGIIKLIFRVTEETDFIVFHLSGINITSKTINEKLRVQRLLHYPEREQVYLETDSPMKPGKTFSVRLKFEYSLSQSLEGFYLSSYKDSKGIERRLATTHFEPTYARRAFPCFDEPQLKAKFTMTITHDKKLTAFFNMPVREQTEVRGRPDRVRNEFATTEKMSTYLVAFVICDFALSSEQTPTHNITVSVIAAKDKLDQADFALHTAAKITEHYEKYFGIRYPLPKQDLIAIPDFGAGAMENWGLITYRETSLLCKEDETSAAAVQWVAIVVAHELAHQWFGNLVTMYWWNDLWLNEGFASWMEYKGVSYTQPAWHMMEQFWAKVMIPALQLDSLASSHPVSTPVKDPKEIEAIFDTISYKKGSSIIHMLENYLGENVLQAGLKEYLNKHKFGNAVTKDLWKALTKATNNKVDVEAMMNTWTLQMGYPLITFSKGDLLDKDTQGWCVKQTRFLASSQVPGSDTTQPPSKYNYTWYVPVQFRTDLTQPQSILLNATHNTSNGHVDLPAKVKWVKANLGGSGFYRVQYPTEVWEELTKQLLSDHTVLSPTDRSQILDDAFSLCRAGILDYSVPLGITEYLAKEESLIVWLTALSHIQNWVELLQDTQARHSSNLWVVRLVKPVYTKLGWEDTGDHVKKLLRQRVLHAAVSAGHEEAISAAKSSFHSLMTNGTPVPANMQELVYSVGIKTGGEAEWSWCHQKYRSTNIPSDRGQLIKALGDSKDIFILQRYLDMALNTTLVRGQDFHSVLSSVASNPVGTLLAWRHLQRHWDTIFEKFHSGSFTMGNIIKSVTSHFSTEFDLNQVRQFFQDREVGAGARALKQSLEQIQINIQFRKKFETQIISWLEKEFPRAST